MFRKSFVCMWHSSSVIVGLATDLHWLFVPVGLVSTILVAKGMSVVNGKIISLIKM